MVWINVIIMLRSLIVSAGHLVNNHSFPRINFQFASAQEVCIGDYTWKTHEIKVFWGSYEYKKMSYKNSCCFSFKQKKVCRSGQQTALQECKAKNTLAQTLCRYCLECSMSSNKHNLGHSSESGKEEEDCLNSNITNSCHNNISVQDCTTLQDHLLYLKHVDHLGKDGHK